MSARWKPALGIPAAIKVLKGGIDFFEHDGPVNGGDFTPLVSALIKNDLGLYEAEFAALEEKVLTNLSRDGYVRTGYRTGPWSVALGYLEMASIAINLDTHVELGDKVTFLDCPGIVLEINLNTWGAGFTIGLENEYGYINVINGRGVDYAQLYWDKHFRRVDLSGNILLEEHTPDMEI